MLDPRDVGVEQTAASADSGQPVQDAELNRLLSQARLIERRGDVEQAKKMYEAIIQQHPQTTLAYHRLGVLLAKEGRLEAAEQQLLAAQQLAPPSTELLNDIGYCYYLQDRLLEAEQIFNQTLLRNTFDPTACNNLAIVVGLQGRVDESLKLFKRVNSEAEAHANLGYVFTQRGEMRQAEAEYRRALTMDKTLRTAAEAAVHIVDRQRLLNDEFSQPEVIAKGSGPHLRNHPNMRSNTAEQLAAAARPAQPTLNSPPRWIGGPPNHRDEPSAPYRDSLVEQVAYQSSDGEVVEVRTLAELPRPPLDRFVPERTFLQRLPQP